VVFDSRSALAAECSEYDVFPVDYIRRNISTFEKEAVEKSDLKMAVSEKLVSHWRASYGYTGNDHVVIPCTLDNKYFPEQYVFNEAEALEVRRSLDFLPDDIVVVYAGSTAPWQSFALLEQYLLPLLLSNEKIKILFLSKETADIKRMKTDHGSRVQVKWVEHKEVLSYLKACDYGLLLREQAVTNLVASPVKFAEYLYAGLHVLITNNLGDFTDFVTRHACGVVMEHASPGLNLPKPDTAEKARCNALSAEYFRKDSPRNISAYEKVVSCLRS
jgi:hypothetical protein